MSEREFDNFDEYAINYRNIHNNNIKLTGGNSDYFCEYKIQELAKIYNHTKFTFLDFGCGDGITYKYFKKYFPDADYLGIDISEESIKRCKYSYPDGNFLVFDGENLPEGTYDVVYSSCVFHHISSQKYDKILTNINHCLNKNGLLIIFEHNPWNPFSQYFVRTCEFDKDAILINHLQFKKTLKRNNFSNIKVNFTLFFPRNKFLFLFHLLEKYLYPIPLGGQYFIYSFKN